MVAWVENLVIRLCPVEWNGKVLCFCLQCVQLGGKFFKRIGVEEAVPIPWHDPSGIWIFLNASLQHGVARLILVGYVKTLAVGDALFDKAHIFGVKTIVVLFF
jgi:hypothetical protein